MCVRDPRIALPEVCEAGLIQAATGSVYAEGVPNAIGRNPDSRAICSADRSHVSGSGVGSRPLRQASGMRRRPIPSDANKRATLIALRPFEWA
jgi:hypothetical protein